MTGRGPGAPPLLLYLYPLALALHGCELTLRRGTSYYGNNTMARIRYGARPTCQSSIPVFLAQTHKAGARWLIQGRVGGVATSTKHSDTDPPTNDS